MRRSKMDGFNNNFGNLSLGASEWQPARHRQQQQQQQQPSSNRRYNDNAINDSLTTTNSEFVNPNQVKEFVPGQGWSVPSTTTTTRTATSSAQQASSGRGDISTTAIVATAEHTSMEKEAYETSIPAGPSPAPMISYRSLHSMSVSDELYRHYRNISLEGIRQMDPNDPQHKAVPLPYCNAFCLDNELQMKRRGRRSWFGYPTSTFQVTNSEDGHMYCLKRFDSVRSVSPKIAQQITDRWTSITAIKEHPNIVPLHQCFVAQRAVFFVYQYIPGARTLSEYMKGPFAESIIWSCISQLVSMIRTVHGNNLAVRTLRLQQCLCTNDATETRLRLRMGNLGIVDALEYEARKHVVDLQMEDIRDLGRFILSLATGTEIAATSAIESINQCEQFLLQNYSRELHNLCMTLIRSQPRPPSIIDVCRATALHSFDEQDAVYQTLDRTEVALASEYESGRALRLLLKLNFVNERPELGPNRRWAQSGDCYVLSLFRDYVFHQADGGGYPVMDLGHVITALNKLDASDEEKIALASRDGKTLMVVSYADVSRSLESAFQELCSNAVPSSSLQF